MIRYLMVTSIAVAALAIASPSGAAAQMPQATAVDATNLAVQAAQAHDDVQWEERIEGYRGGPIRPGTQLGWSINGLTWAGVATFLGGYLLALPGIGGREYGAIPIVGPWLAAAGALGGQEWETGSSVFMVLAGVAQAAGIVLAIVGLALPSYFVVYDAPVGSPSPYARLSVVPAAPGTDVGAALVLEAF